MKQVMPDWLFYVVTAVGTAVVILGILFPLVPATQDSYQTVIERELHEAIQNQGAPLTEPQKDALQSTASELSASIMYITLWILAGGLFLFVICGLIFGTLLSRRANAVILESLQEDVTSVVKDIDQIAVETKESIGGALEVVQETADHIKQVFEKMKHHRLYLMGQAHQDLLLSKYTFVLGKLTYLVDAGSNELLSQVKQRQTWAVNSGIVFIVTKHMGSELMKVCKKLATFKSIMPSAEDYTKDDLSQAFVAIIDGDYVESFPLQIVSYTKGSDIEITNWNQDTILSLLNDKDVPVMKDKAVTERRTLRYLVSEIVAFLDDLVLQVSQERKADNGNGKTVLDELIGISMKTDQQTESLFGAFHKIVGGDVANDKADPVIINLGSLVDFCKACPRNDECRKTEGVAEEYCQGLDKVQQGGKTRFILKPEVLTRVS